MEPIETRSLTLFSFEPVPESPRVAPPETGLRLAARNVAYNGQALSLELLTTYRFEPAFVAAFQQLMHAVIMGLEDADAGRASALRTLDPRRRYPPRAGPNFMGLRPGPITSGRTGGSVVMPIEILLPPPTVSGPSFYATAFLQNHVSNTLAFDLHAGSVTSLLHSVLCDPALEGTDEKDVALWKDEVDEVNVFQLIADPLFTPVQPSAPPALALTAHKTGSYAPGEPILLEATLALPPEELEAFGAVGWLRALFAWCSRQDSQATRVGHWLADRVVFADDFRDRLVAGQPRAVATAPFDLVQILKAPLMAGVHYVQVSARHHRSNVLEIVCR